MWYETTVNVKFQGEVINFKLTNYVGFVNLSFRRWFNSLWIRISFTKNAICNIHHFSKKKKNSTHSCKNLQKIKAIKRIEYCNIEWLSMALLDSERRLSWESVPNKRRLLNLPKMQSVLVSPKDSLAYLSRRDKPAQQVLSVMMRALKKTLRTFISWKNKWKKEIYKRSGGC